MSKENPTLIFSYKSRNIYIYKKQGIKKSLSDYVFSLLEAFSPDDWQKDYTGFPQDKNRIEQRERQFPEAKWPANDVAPVHPDGHKGDVEEMVRQHKGPLDDAAEQASRPIGPAAAEVLEAAQLEGAQLAVVGGE